MDWERKRDKASLQTPNAWRHIFVVNELNELQMQRFVSIELTIIFYVFLQQGEGWQYWSNLDPSFVEEETYSPNSYILKYF